MTPIGTSGSNKSLSMAVVEAVAAELSVGPNEIQTPIFEVIDPDALDALLNHSRNGQDTRFVQVTFEYEGYEVVASSNEHIEVTNQNRVSPSDR